MKTLPYAHQYQWTLQEKGSKFIAYAFPVFSEEDVKERLRKFAKRIRSKASLLCDTYIQINQLGVLMIWRACNTVKNQFGANTIKDLTNILIVVVRYFGGVKLGVGGLITAYRAAAADALEGISIEKRFVKEIYEVAFQYPQMNEVMRLVKDKSLEVVNQDFQIDCKLIFAIRKSQADAVVAAFKKNHELTINPKNNLMELQNNFVKFMLLLVAKLL